MRYADVSITKTNGAVYTPQQMACYLADELVRIVQVDSSKEVRVLDPAIGDGELNDGQQK